MTTTEAGTTPTESGRTTTEEELTTEETTTTSQQTPGFGIAVAMLALIGAALIALRRRD
jgi:PGF-CTERM protein